MKAAVLERAQQPLVLTDVPSPALGPGDVLVRIRACGVCHTDLHVADGLLGSFGYNPYPVIPGHEITGCVEAVGADVQRVRPGQRVGVYWWFGCGHCRSCLTGREQACAQAQHDLRAAGLTLNGGYAEQIVVPADYVIELPDGLDDVLAAPLFCAGLTMYAALKGAGVTAASRVAVVGIGGLGHLAVQLARALGAEVIAVTSSEAKVEIARQLGAGHVVAASSGRVGEELRGCGGADVILSTTLDFQTIRDVLKGLLPLGTLVVTGMMPGRLPLDPRSFILGQQRIVGMNIGSRQDLRELLQLAVRHNIRPRVEVYPLEEVNQVHQRLRDNEVRFRAVLDLGDR